MVKSINTLEQIHSSGLRFLEPLSIEETYRTVINEAMKLTASEYGTLFMNDRNNFSRVYSSVPLNYQIEPRKRGLLYRTFKSNKITIISRKQFKEHHPEFEDPHTKSFVFIPLSHKNKITGVISLRSKKYKHFTKARLEILKLFSSFAYLAIQKTQLYSTAIDALEARDLFIAIAAHNFRTPLTSMIGYTDMICKKAQNNQIPKIEWLKTMKSDINHLKNLLNNLMESTQIKAGKFEYHFTQCNVCKIIEKSIANFEESKPPHKVNLKNHIHESNCLLIGDQDKLREVFLHILNNSAEFSPPDTPINVEIKTNKYNINVIIIDSGSGIPLKDRPHIFKQFYRGSNTRREGMGMGLFLAKSIIEKHRGDIKINSGVNKGTKVTITFPRLKYERTRRQNS